VTVGGAIASDIHGKDHHRVGSFGSHLSALTLATPTGTVSVSPEVDPDLFWATTGGMGLTGIVLDATIRLRRIETSRLAVDTDRPGDLDEVLALMEAEDHRYRYSVAWLDLTARGRRTGGASWSGRFATPDQLGPRDRRSPLDSPRTLARPTVVPRLISRHGPSVQRGLVPEPLGDGGHISSFFPPLDLVDHWNRACGPGPAHGDRTPHHRRGVLRGGGPVQ
jgi:decaprenylphospho-beta-D-ribofuranose 2-oxidase